jgi:Protein of unknown function (DUF3563)
MKATNFALRAPVSTGIGTKLGPSTVASRRAANTEYPPTLLERFDRWLWRQHVREREAYLADSKDIFELEERIRRLERSIGGRYY